MGVQNQRGCSKTGKDVLKQETDILKQEGRFKTGKVNSKTRKDVLKHKRTTKYFALKIPKQYRKCTVQRRQSKGDSPKEGEKITEIQQNLKKKS